MKHQRKRKTIEEVNQFLQDIDSESILLETQYINNSTPLKFMCKCGNIFYKNFTNIQQRKSCMCGSCARKNGWRYHRGVEDKAEQYLQDFANYGYKVIQENEVLTRKEKVLVQDEDGYRGYISLENVLKHKHFSIFSIKFNKDNLLFNLNHYCELHNIDTRVIRYWQDKRVVRIECICECGNHYTTNVGDFTTQYRVYCKSCTKKESNLEKKVKNELLQYDVNFIQQKTFEDCRSDITAYRLPFDFYLVDYNCCIEVDGEQHYHPVNFNGLDENKAKIAYERTKYNDSIKTKFCELKDIQLIRISYQQIKNGKYKQIIQTIIR